MMRTTTFPLENDWAPAQLLRCCASDSTFRNFNVSTSEVKKKRKKTMLRTMHTFRKKWTHENLQISAEDDAKKLRLSFFRDFRISDSPPGFGGARFEKNLFPSPGPSSRRAIVHPSPRWANPIQSRNEHSKLKKEKIYTQLEKSCWRTFQTPLRT